LSTEEKKTGLLPVMEEHMEQKAKRIGKFNIVDIIAVILILAVLVFAGYKLAARDGGEISQKETVKVTYVARAEDVPKEVYDNCLEYLPSPLMASGELVGGQIESVEKEPYYVLGPDGQWVEDPDHVTLYFTVTTESEKEEVMTTKVGDQEIRVGKAGYILKSEYIELKDCVIVDVQWVDE
jgi:hypothetical protein